MESRLDRKELFSGLVDALNLAVMHERLDDAERVLAGLRALRPRMLELDTFEAWIALKRGHWTDAVRLLNNIAESASRGSGLAKALLAFCQCATGDARWVSVAQQVVDAGDSQEAIGLVRLLLHPEPGTDVVSGTATAAPVAATDSHPIPAVYAALRV
jgi:type III secretion protein HrpB1